MLFFLHLKKKIDNVITYYMMQIVIKLAQKHYYIIGRLSHYRQVLHYYIIGFNMVPKLSCNCEITEYC